MEAKGLFVRYYNPGNGDIVDEHLLTETPGVYLNGLVDRGFEVRHVGIGDPELTRRLGVFMSTAVEADGDGPLPNQ